jgi:hypothetical protein
LKLYLYRSLLWKLWLGITQSVWYKTQSKYVLLEINFNCQFTGIFL